MCTKIFLKILAITLVFAIISLCFVSCDQKDYATFIQENDTDNTETESNIVEKDSDAEEHVHTNLRWVTDKSPTKTEDGYKSLICLYCQAIIQQERIPACGSQGLSYRVNADGITCTITGIGSCSDKDIFIGEYKLCIRKIIRLHIASTFRISVLTDQKISTLSTYIASALANTRI